MTIFQRINHEAVEGIRCGRKNNVNTSFIVYRFGDTVIDTAPSNQWRYIKPFIREKTIRQILLTHHHEDHSGNAVNLQQLTGVTPMAAEGTRTIMEQGFSIPLIQKYLWGKSPAIRLAPLPDTIELEDGSTLEAIAAPGHAEDMVCFYSSEHGFIFTADLYISRTIRYMRDDENLTVLIKSIRKVLARDFETLLCPHRGVVLQGKQALQEKLNNLLELCEKAQHLHHQGQSVKQITRNILGTEDGMSYLTGFSFSKRNLIRESLKVTL
ncbi:MBL fold metallo-hydrolase [Endozoicomonas sp.]|uniref:MBL fold metallo-hydrolase n=1 Tax=Endozoicomonas sp. TaxID=1892382 RepID=UPI00383A2BB0